MPFNQGLRSIIGSPIYSSSPCARDRSHPWIAVFLCSVAPSVHIRTVAFSPYFLHLDPRSREASPYFCTGLYHALTNVFSFSRSPWLSYLLHATVFLAILPHAAPARLAPHVYYSSLMYLIIPPVLIPKCNSHFLL